MMVSLIFALFIDQGASQMIFTDGAAWYSLIVGENQASRLDSGSEVCGYVGLDGHLVAYSHQGVIMSGRATEGAQKLAKVVNPLVGHGHLKWIGISGDQSTWAVIVLDDSQFDGNIHFISSAGVRMGKVRLTDVFKEYSDVALEPALRGRYSLSPNGREIAISAMSEPKVSGSDFGDLYVYRYNLGTNKITREGEGQVAGWIGDKIVRQKNGLWIDSRQLVESPSYVISDGMSVDIFGKMVSGETSRQHFTNGKLDSEKTSISLQWIQERTGDYSGFMLRQDRTNSR